MQVVATILLVLVLLVPILMTQVSPRVDRTMTALALQLFGPIVGLTGQVTVRKQRLRAAHIPTTYSIYAANTVLFSIVIGLAGSLMALLGIYGMFVLMGVSAAGLELILPPSLSIFASLAEVRSAGVTTFVMLAAVFILVIGPWVALSIYGLRWWYPAYEANIRQRRIEAAMPRTMAFMFALSRSGMSVPAIMSVLAEHRRVYGAAAEEMTVAIRSMEGFGVDMITAITTMGRRSASPRFAEFSENLASVLQSGRDVPSFFRDQYERYQEEAESYQEQLLTVLATTAEVWVSLLVGGPLFLITILVVIGVTIQDTLPLLQLIIYVVLPMANLAFIVYLGMLFDRIEGSQTIGVDAITEATAFESVSPGARARADGGAVEPSPIRHNLRQLTWFNRLEYLRKKVSNPLKTIIDDPRALLLVTIPIAIGYILVRLPGTIVDGTPEVSQLDTIILQALLFVLITFALVYEIHRRRIDSIERNVPDLLDRLASVNEAGMTLVASIGRVRHGGLGRLDIELDYIWQDIQWGATLETALRRFEGRVRTQVVSRVVTLLVMSMRASGEVSSVLRIAASQAKSDRRLKEARRQEMTTYVFIAYLSFLVFLVVLGALNSVMLPNLPDVTVDPGDAATITSPVFGQIGQVDEAAYEMVFYHAVLIQGFFAGLIAGHMSAADIKNGAKHAAIMVLLGWLIFGVVL